MWGMGANTNPRVSPVELVALATRLNHDEQRPRGELVERDRTLAAKLRDAGGPPTDDAALLGWWLDHATDAEADDTADRVRGALSLAGAGLTLLGLLLGAGVALGVFYYDGQQPVNVIAALGVFVFLQALTLLLAVVAVLPAGWVAWVPGVGGLQAGLRRASPGRLAFVLARLMPQPLREAIDSGVGRSGAHRRVYGRVQLWAVVRWSQLFAFAFNLAGLAVFVALVVFTDLAFGWSTTLSVEPASFHRMTSVVSLPWVWFGDAVPTLELVERSRYFRGQTFDPVARGAWWPFVMLAMGVYGLLPRLAALVWSHVAVGRASRNALVATPGALAVVRRLRGHATEPARDENTAIDDASEYPSGGVGDRPVVIDWSSSAGPVERVSALLRLPVDEVLHAGGSCSIAEDAATVQRAGASVKDAADGLLRGVVLLVKRWEPPTLEVLEFLRALRGSVGDAVPIRVCPVAEDAAGQVVSADPEHLAQWARRIRSVGDPWLVVEPPTEGGPSSA